MSRPSKSTASALTRPGGEGTSPMTDREVTLFPQPDSPTRPTVLPRSTVKLTPSTARNSPRPVWKCVLRLRASSRGASMRSLLAPDIVVSVGRGTLRPRSVAPPARRQRTSRRMFVRRLHRIACFCSRSAASERIIEPLVERVLVEHVRACPLKLLIGGEVHADVLHRDPQVFVGDLLLDETEILCPVGWIGGGLSETQPLVSLRILPVHAVRCRDVLGVEIETHQIAGR